MSATSPRIRLSPAGTRGRILVLLGLVFAVAAAVLITVLSVQPAPADSVPAGHLPLHTTGDTCTVVHPGSEC